MSTEEKKGVSVGEAFSLVVELLKQEKESSEIKSELLKKAQGLIESYGDVCGEESKELQATITKWGKDVISHFSKERKGL